MTDFLQVSPPEGGLATALSYARSRRYRKAALSSGFAAAALSCVALLAGSSGTQTLIQERRPELPAVTGVQEVEQSDTSETTPNTAARIAATSPRGDTDRTAAHATTSRPDDTGDAPHAEPLLPRTATPYRAGPVHREDNTGLALCDVDASQEAERLCPAVYFAPGAKGYDMQAEVCSTHARTVSLGYDTSSEVDFVVTDRTGKELWRWSHWHPAADTPHFVSIDTGRCVFWTVAWTAVDATGHKLPTGTYSLRAVFLADELSEQREVRREISIG